MTKETEKRFCRVCDGQLEFVPEEPVDYKTVPLYYCEHCEKLYRFYPEVKGEYDYENDKTIYE